MNPAIFIALIAAMVGTVFAASGVALRRLSKKRLADRLEAKGKIHRLPVFLSNLPALILMTGMLRVCCTMIVVLSVFHVFDTSMVGQPRKAVYGWSFAVSGVIVGAFVVALPASIGRYYREKLLVFTMPILALVTAWPLAWVPKALHVFDPIVRRISGHDRDVDDQDVSDELMSVVEESEFAQHVDEDQREILEAVFDMPNTDAADLMTPRTDVRGIDLATPGRELIHEIVRIGHSRIPMFEESLDRIVGVLYVKDLLPLLVDGVGEDGDFDLRAILREPYLVPEGKKISELIEDFKRLKVQMALVIDEHGGTAGLITVEDVMEELVGDMQDEYETEHEPEPITRVNDHAAEVDARAHIDVVNDELDLGIPNDADYDTLGGFVFDRLGHIPARGEVFEDQGVRYVVMDVERTRVNRVRIEWDG